MTRIEFEVARARAEVAECERVFAEAVRFANRMMGDLNQAVENGWTTACSANNVATAAIEVGQIGERLAARRAALKTVEDLNGCFSR
jgi:hypothetical protein